MDTNTITNIKLCFPREKYLQEGNFERHLISATHLIKTRTKKLCYICKNLNKPQNNQAHPQSQECIRKRKTFFEVCKIIIRDIHKLITQKTSKKCITNKQGR